MSRCLLLVMSILLLSGCMVDDSSGGDETRVEVDTTDRQTGGDSSNTDTVLQRTLVALTDDVFSPNFSQMVTDSQALSVQVQAYCAATPADELVALQGAQSSWSTAQSTWQRISAVQVEPMTENGNRLGGRIYSWPDQVSSCTLDRQVVLSQDSGYDIATAPRQGRGLDALEYLLFNSDLSTACSRLVPETAIWNATSDADKRSQRCQYAVQVAGDLVQNATELEQNWTSYKVNLTQAGTDQSSFDSANAALNQITDALFYLDKEVKDRKLASVLGLSNTSGTCGNSTCADLREAPWSEASLAHIRDNLVGFRQAFIASLQAQALSQSDQVGFDYQLAVRNFPDLSVDILQLTDVAISIIDDIDAPFSELVATIDRDGLNEACINASSNRSVSEGVEVCALHGTIKQITDLLKTDFLTLMTLSLPERVEGDND